MLARAARLDNLPPDTLLAVLSLLSAHDLSSVTATSHEMQTAAGGDALWAPHALQVPQWQRCGNPLPSQTDGTCAACERMVAGSPAGG